MDSSQRSLVHHGPSSDNSSPILIIAILGITITAILLLSYYIFVIKCWLNCHRMSFLRQIFTTQARRYEDPVMAYDVGLERRGVDELVIQAIPIFRYKKGGHKEDEEERSFYECAVCLNEFQDEEKLRVLPSCAHPFHIDCIDIWLQSNANCPLCRSSISSNNQASLHQIIAPSSSPTDTVIGGDEDFVVIEVRSDTVTITDQSSLQETVKSGEVSSKCIISSPRKLESKKLRKFHHGTSMGDECIDTRGNDNHFSVQLVRRSFSMDSSTDRQLFLAVQDIIQQKRALNEVSTSEDCSSRTRRSIFSFSHCRGSRNVVLPNHFES